MNFYSFGIIAIYVFLAGWGIVWLTRWLRNRKDALHTQGEDK